MRGSMETVLLAVHLEFHADATIGFVAWCHSIVKESGHGPIPPQETRA